MRKDWKNSLRDSLSDFQAPEPEGLWAVVEKRIAAGADGARTSGAGAAGATGAAGAKAGSEMRRGTGEGRSESRVLVPLSLALAGAAALLLLLLLPGKSENSLEVLPANTNPQTAEVLPATSNLQPTEALSGTSNPQPNEALAGTSNPLTVEVFPATRQPQVAETMPAVTKPSGDPQPGINVSNDSQTFKTDIFEDTTAPAGQSIDDISDYYEPQRQPARRPRINLIAMACGTPNSHSSMQNYSTLPCSDIATSLQSLNYNDFAYRNFSSTVTSNLGREVSTQTTHRQPIRLALEAEYMLTDRFGLISGLSFSRLVSDLKSGGENYYHTVQKLDYIGIPLRLSWHLVDSQRFMLYTGIGGMVEKCIGGSVTTSYSLYGENVQGESLKVMDQPLVFSFDASMGFGINLWSTGRSGSSRGGNSAAAGVGQPGGYGAYLFNAASIVIEPGLSWHIPDGGTISNIYRDRPLNFSLTIALRFSL